MTGRPRTTAALLAVAAAALLSSCGDASKPQAPPARSELPELAAQSENWAKRAELVSQRPWAARLEFSKRLYPRIQALRTFVQEAAASAENGTPPERLVERGRALVNRAGPFDAALTLVERQTDSLDKINGYARLIELHMPPLETRGEAPYRIRVSNVNQQAALGYEYLDKALASLLDQAPDSQLNENIATAQLRQALETSAKLADEVKKFSALASAAVDRQRLLKSRIEWAEGVARKAGDGTPPEAARALEDARTFSAGPFVADTDAVLEKLRNAQPDAAERAAELASRADAIIERLTGSFLDLGRKTGVADPR